MSVKLPTEQLVEQYANAAPAYATKTQVEHFDSNLATRHKLMRSQNLQIPYPEYRKITGDRKCGWRGIVLNHDYHNHNSIIDISTAIIFVFCEILIQLGDVPNITREKNRLMNLNQSISLIGDGYAGLFEDMSADFIGLLDDMSLWIDSRQDAMSNLEKFFNSDVAQNVIYVCRVH